MTSKPRLHPALWTLILFTVIVALTVGTATAFNRDFQSYATVTLTSDRAGLVMSPYAQVKFRGVQIGRVASIRAKDQVQLQLELYPDQLKYIPANVEAQITAPTAFGSKYVELLDPNDPSRGRLAAGAVLRSRNVTVEVNTVFQNLAGVLDQIDPAKLNAVLSALAEGFRGKGQAIGAAITDFNQVLLAVNPRSETIRDDWHALQGFSDTYSSAAPNILTVLDAASTTSATIVNNAKALDSLLLNVVGLANSGINVIGPNKDNLVQSINLLEPTTRLLMKYNPELTCLFTGATKVLASNDDGGYGWTDTVGGQTGYSGIVDVALLLGDDLYKYPDNLPVTGQKGGPGGQPGCGGLPDIAQHWPKRYLVTNSGWGTGLDLRPNPGIGFPGYANFFPVTRGVPEPPKVSKIGPPAPGPVPYPGAPPYGAPEYAPDGTPLYPGLPPAPPPGRPQEPGPPPPGSEPSGVDFPAQVHPTPAPLPDPPPPAVMAPPASNPAPPLPAEAPAP